MENANYNFIKILQEKLLNLSNQFSFTAKKKLERLQFSIRFSKFEVPVNLKYTFELFGYYTTCFLIQKLLDHHLMVTFGEKAEIKKAGNLN